MSGTQEAADPAVEARELAARLEADGTARLDTAWELVTARQTIGTLRAELDTERRRLDASLRGMGGAPPVGGVRRQLLRAIPALVLVVGGMLAFVLLSWGTAVAGPRVGLWSCVPAVGSR